MSMDINISRALFGVKETKVKSLGNSLGQVCGEEVLEKLSPLFGNLPGNVCNY